jgi:hypothetical protein
VIQGLSLERAPSLPDLQQGLKVSSFRIYENLGKRSFPVGPRLLLRAGVSILLQHGTTQDELEIEDARSW